VFGLKPHSLLAIGCGVLVATCAVLRVETALQGQWVTELFGIKLWRSSDPFGWYLGSALALGDAHNPYLSFPGHSGSVLSLCLWAIGRGGYLLSDSTDYPTYVARELTTIVYVARLWAAAMQLGSAVLAYRIVRIWFRSGSMASASAAAFMLAWPTQFYLVRPAPEVTSTFLVLLSVWCWSRFERGSPRSEGSRAYAFWSGAASMLAAQEKFTVMLPLTVLLGAMFATIPGHQRAMRVRTMAVFILGGLIAGLVTFVFVDWRWVVETWSFLARDPARYYSAGVQGLKRPHLLVSLAIMAPAWIVGLVGAGHAWKRPSIRRLVVFLGMLVVATTPGAVGRGAFHYWLIHAIVAAVFCGVAVVELARRCPAPARTMVGCLLILVVSGPSLAGALSLYRSDRRSFAGWHAWVVAIEGDRPIRIDDGDCSTFGVFFPGLYPAYTRSSRSEIGDRFCAQFVAGPQVTADAVSLVRRGGGWVLLPSPVEEAGNASGQLPSSALP